MDAFDQVQNQANSSQFTLGSISGTHRSGASRNNPVMPLTDKSVAGVELTFVINAGVAVDINSLNAAMTSTGATGFAQVFYTKATAAGQVISMPTVTVCAILVLAVSFAAPLNGVCCSLSDGIILMRITGTALMPSPFGLFSSLVISLQLR